MSRTEKQLQRLTVMEEELRSRLLAELARVAQGFNTLFFVTEEFNPGELRHHMLSAESAELSRLATDVLSLRARLGEPREGSVGDLLRSALERYANVDDHQRLGPIRLAEELLVALRRTPSARDR